MDSKNRLAIAIAITCLIVVAIFASFGRSLFFVHIPSITLSDASSEEPPASGSSGPEAADQYWQVDVTPETVQSIVATLIRPDSYYRELTVETLWSGGSFSSSVQYWQDRAWSHTRQDLASGAVRHDLAGPEKAYYWYEGSSAWNALPADERSHDLAQHIPTYETVLQLRQSAIVTADYRQLEGLSCIYVEVRLDDPQRTERYWIGLDSGLLVQAETEEEGTLTYRLSALSPITTAYDAADAFSLPDGTSLHNVT